MVKVLNSRYEPVKSVKKGVEGGAVAGVGGAVATLLLVGVGALQGGGLDEAGANALSGAVLVLLTSGVGGAVAWWRNRKKHKFV